MSGKGVHKTTRSGLKRKPIFSSSEDEEVTVTPTSPKPGTSAEARRDDRITAEQRAAATAARTARAAADAAAQAGEDTTSSEEGLGEEDPGEQGLSEEDPGEQDRGEGDLGERDASEEDRGEQERGEETSSGDGERQLYACMYQVAEKELTADLEERYPGPAFAQARRGKLEYHLDCAQRRIPRRLPAEGIFNAVNRKVNRMAEVLEKLKAKIEGPVTDEHRKRASLEVQRWEHSLKSEFLFAQKRVEDAYYGLIKEEDPLSEKAEATLERLNDAMFPFLPDKKGAKDSEPAAAPATPAAAAPAAAVVTARAFKIKEYIGTIFSGEGEPSEILGGFRRWIQDWNLALPELNQAPGISNAVRLIKLQQAVKGKALALVQGIPAETEDGYELALKKLTDTYDDPVGLATALFKAAIGDKRPRLFQETQASVMSLREDMKKQGVSMEEFLWLSSVLRTLTTKETASWKRYVVSLRTRFGAEQARKSAEEKLQWKVGMAYNMEAFSNWKEESQQEELPAEEGGIHLAGTAFKAPDPGTSSYSPKSGCAVHGWMAQHLSGDCLTLKRMDSRTWINLATTCNACFRCGQHFGRSHHCSPGPCDNCHAEDHAAFRCGRSDSDRAAYRVKKSSPSGSRSRGTEQAGFSGNAPKKPRLSGTNRSKGGRSKSPKPSPSGQPPTGAPGTSGFSSRGRGRGKRPGGGGRQKGGQE